MSLLPTKTFFVSIYDPHGVVFEGDVRALTTSNEDGEFDVFAEYTNIITVISTNIRLHFDEQNERFLPLEKGILRMMKGRADVYLGVEALKVVEE